MADILGIFNHIQQQGEKGKQSRLARMLGEAYNAPMGQRQDALGQVAKVDGGLAMQAGKAFREEDGEVLSQLSDHARQVVALYKADPNMAQQAYQAMLPLAQRAGISSAPQQLDDTVIGGLTQLAAVNSKAGVPAGFQEFDLLSQAGKLGDEDRARAARIRLGMDPRASSAAIQYREVEGPDGRKRLVALDPRDVGAHTIGGGASYGSGVPSPQGGAPQQQAPQGIPPGVTPQQIQAAYQAIGERNGFEITSMQRPVMPGVGAGANSQHPHGTAVDYRTRGKTREQIEALKRDLAAAGFEVIDESDGRTGTGPHIHAELPRGAGQSQQGTDPFTSRRKEDEAYATEQAKLRAQEEGRLAPEGMRWNADRTALEPIAGGKQDVENIDRQTSTLAKRRMLEQRTPRLLRDVQRGIELAESASPIKGAWATPGEGAGFLRRAGAAALTPDTFELNQHLESVKSNISIDQLQQMREASPTGGALGQIPVRQQEYLMSLLGTLRADLRPEVLKENLAGIYNDYLKLMVDAVYGGEEEHQLAIRRGDMTEAESRELLAEREQVLREQTQQDPFNVFGRRKGRESSPQSSNIDLRRRALLDKY